MLTGIGTRLAQVLPLRSRLAMDAWCGLQRELNRAGLVPDAVREACSSNARELEWRFLLHAGVPL